ncbi:reverse transcriptase domain-containing protein [Shewanella chilikensis]|uniref:RNA-directed DNA polymerase n=1 Tax=Shewanella chilikensis TaxID=558541 RepID=A0A6G7LQD1_9GAMM|nr:reverse transcriptase domain-containing protein [Shewanella chilikensis]QIJ03969.1 trypsin-like serine protease [Shewanella chilikensis]
MVDIAKIAAIAASSSFTSVPVPVQLKDCTCVEGLAKYLGFKDYDELKGIVYPSTSHHYKSFRIPKKNGDFRTIEAPRKQLKKLLKRISTSLEEVYSPRNATHGFVKGRSIVTNASKHADKKYVLNLDLNDFFGTIHFGRLRNLFQSHPLNLSHSVATVLSHICCHNGKLPQGSPASPIISNMIAYRLDKQLQTLASKNRSTFTRYADDLTFSFTQTRGRLPKQIVSLSRDLQLKLGHELTDIVNENGFSINSSKTRISARSHRQDVTGIIVNERMNVTRKYIKQTKSMIYAWKKFGIENAEDEYLKNYHGKKIFEKHQRRINEKKGQFFRKIVKGRVNFIKMVRGSDDLIYRKLAYDFSALIGKPKPDLIRTPLDKACDSIFIIENMLDQSQGTGFLLKGIGIVTNEHVVSDIDEDLSDLLELFRHHEQDIKRPVKFQKSCKSRDLAILKPTTSYNGIKRLPVGDDSQLGVGSKVTVLGFPQYSPGETPYINTGKIIQSKLLYNEKIWLLDIPVIHGNSGGPVLNERQEVVGVAAIGSPKHDNSTKLHGFIPISTLINYAQENNKSNNNNN